ncbi:MAG: protein translocase subunit SecDF [Chitinophaga sp.]|jgi:SecD/SecF fusion protein|nr:protein translocase subunit SecDF [Chitinophaga sp.]
MQLKGLVRFFAIALILICLYTLSFTWIVRSYESTVSEKAEKRVKALYSLTPEQKYASNAELKAAYADTLKQAKDSITRYLLDSSTDVKVGPFGWTTYRSAKDKELQLGLDLQGGISVTMEVGLDGLIKSLSNYSKDEKFNTALNNAIARKANSGADLISLFVEEYKKINPSGSLAAFFSAQSNGKIKFSSSEGDVVSYLKDQASAAFKNTVRIIRTRVDKFGVSSPNINPDEKKGIINIELAGANNPERVKTFLQSTANLQFFEVYTLTDEDFVKRFIDADKVAEDYLKGVKAIDSTSAKKDTIKTVAKVNKDTTKIANLSSFDSGKQSTAKVDSNTIKGNANPIRKYLQFPELQDKSGKPTKPSIIGYVLSKDTAALNRILRLDIVKNKFPANLQFLYGKVDAAEDSKAKNVLMLYAIKTLDNGQAELDGEGITATPDYDELSRPAIRMQMDAKGSRIWAKMTERNVGRPIAIVLDNIVYSAPNVNGAITGGNSQISGSFTTQQAQDLAEILMTGKLPAPAKIVQSYEIGATLGDAAVKGGSMAFIISFIIIFGLMLLYYNTAGWVANIALILNLLFTIGILTAMGFTLTAAGIAGLVLTIGMAVDTNVIIFERIKEELTKGKGYAAAVNDGYKRSLAPVLDAHVTTLLTAIILAYFGLGPVLGFATTQIIGILLSLFCGILVSRLITDMYAGKNNRHFEYFTSFSKKIFKHASYKFIEYRKVAYGISVVVLILGIASYFNGFDKGVEFEGGRSYTIKFDKPVQQEVVTDELKKVFNGEAPVIKKVGGANQLNITTAYKIEETGKNIDSLVERALFTGLKNHLPENLTYTEFDSKYKQSSQTVLPTISDDLKSGAAKATIFAIIVICLYIFIRFRDWRYSLGTIFSLLHDVFVTLIVFSFARKIVPFPLEIDQHFIAAILTVIGFSMNDTVIVYDRIREDSKLFKGETNAQIINKAINQTLSRTVMTSLTVFLTILILFIFGGEVTRGFAFAMLIGVITGTYSSIFVAAPILVDFAKDKPLGKSEKK